MTPDGCFGFVVVWRDLKRFYYCSDCEIVGLWRFVDVCRVFKGVLNVVLWVARWCLHSVSISWSAILDGVFQLLPFGWGSLQEASAL